MRKRMKMTMRMRMPTIAEVDTKQAILTRAQMTVPAT